MSPPAKTQPEIVTVTTNKKRNNAKNKKTQRKPLFPVRPGTAVSEFREASGASLPGNREVILEFEDYGDAVGTGWNCLGYDFETLPGLEDAADLSQSINLRSVDVHVLPPAMTANTATNNVMVMAGTSMLGEGGNPVTSLCAARQTIIAPSNVPTWMRVLHVDFLALKKQNFDNVFASNWTEVARLALVNPDTGDFSTATTLQTKIVLRYSIALPLTNPVNTAVNVVALSTANPAFDNGVIIPNAIVYPRVIGLTNQH